MKASIYRISLDIQDAYANVSLDVKRGDYGRKIHLTLMDGGIPYKISKECYAVLSAEKPDGKKIFNHCTIEGNTIIYVMTPQTVAAVGVAECEVKVYGADDQLLTSACFNLVINDTVNEEDQLISEDEVDALTHLISEATTTITESNEATEAAMNATEEARTTTAEGNALIDDLRKARKDLDNRFATKADDLRFNEDTDILSLMSEGKPIGTSVKLPKPNLRQEDPTKGDYVKGREDFVMKKDVPVLVVTSDGITVSHSHTEILAVHNEGKAVFLHLGANIMSYAGKDAMGVYFDGVIRDNRGVTHRRAFVRNNGFYKNMEETIISPAYSASQNGMVMTVQDGSVVWAEMDMESVNQDLKSIKADIADLKYFPIEITAFGHKSTSNTGTISKEIKKEYGSKAHEVNLAWEINKAPKTLALNGEALDASSTTKYVSNGEGWTLTKRWTLKATDEKDNSAEETFQLSFYKPLYHGALDADVEITREVILGLSKTLNADKKITFKATTGANQKLTFVQPSSYAEPVFTIDPFSYSWVPVKVLENFENSSGYVESYTVWQEPEIIPGTSTVKVT